ncbi:MAG TPA: Ig-like domain-containing protein [Thermoanaerobaculia bacterium]|nr:Ig-like domain-containing protein [Thermoanaerobaculia bacterium]
MRRLPIALIVFSALSAQAGVTFVAPLPGSQAIGVQMLEVRTDAPDVTRVDFRVDGVLAGVARTAPYRIAFDFGTSLTARTIEAVVWSNGYTTSERATVTTAALTANETLDVDLVEVPLRARSSSPLRPSDLRIRENGVEQTIRDVKRERPPAHFAFIVDRSLSMGDGKLDAALAAIAGELHQLRDGDSASLVLFHHIVTKAQPIAKGRTLPADLISSGGTSLRDALASVASDNRTYAIVITDGGDRNSELSDEDALRAISGTRTSVHALVLGRAHTRFLDRAAQNTGGAVIATSRDALRADLAGVLTDINGRFLVIYQSHGTKRGWRAIDVRAKRRGIEILSARKGYFAR